MTSPASSKLNSRPLGRRYTTIALYRSAAVARGAVTKLHQMGVDLEAVSLIGKAHLSDQPADSTEVTAGSPLFLKAPTTLGSDLARLGIGEQSAANYLADFADGKSILIVHGSLAQTGLAASLLEKTLHFGLAEYAE